MRAGVLAFVFTAAVVDCLNMEDPVIEKARKFVTGHKHGNICLEAFEDAEGIIGGFSHFDKHMETAETLAQKLAEATGKPMEELEKRILARLHEATEAARPTTEPEDEEGRKAALAKMRSPLHAMELCEFALRHHDEL
ncbi:unnamed protein product [Prorocentrum cordatum]|uniref:Uncharacterized protein n=1 Tax=Prorocentrum cordatum TaxID=2364126 RepID=A0ABN9TY39_9DINO|nr:unnamed protein product [Polarella glacialis]|mmetsp:Transcript_110239/g.299029  ORF Transcript_110239/g.299029 Transcript_110239/m.299029 type:complete len:138 (+) Transcript_110239:125-538(+)